MTQQRVADDVLARWTRRNHHLEEKFLKGADPEPILQGMQWLAEGRQLQVVEDDPLGYSHKLYGYVDASLSDIVRYNTVLDWGLNWPRSLDFQQKLGELTGSGNAYVAGRNSDTSVTQLIWVAQLDSPLRTLKEYVRALVAKGVTSLTEFKKIMALTEEQFRLTPGVEFQPNSLKLVRINLKAGFDGQTETSAYQSRSARAAWVEALAAVLSFNGWRETLDGSDANTSAPMAVALGGCQFRYGTTPNYNLGIKLGGWKADMLDEAWHGSIHIGDCRHSSSRLAVPTVETLGFVSW